MPVDFVIDQKETPREEAIEIIKCLAIKRIKGNKPSIWMIAGDSGEGKSWTALTLMMLILEAQGLNPKDYLKDCFIFTPFEYSDKVNKILFDKEMKKVNVLILDEARGLLNAKEWYSYVNRAISDINAMSRGIKPLVIIIVSQYSGDIEKGTRRTLTYYCKCYRPIGHRVRFSITRIWLDERDFDNPKIRRRRLVGLLRTPNGNKRFHVNFKFNRPPKELSNEYEILQREAKGKLIQGRFKMMIDNLEKKFKGVEERAGGIAEFYGKNPETLRTLVEYKKGKPRLKKGILEAHNIKESEGKLFEKMILEKLEEGGFTDATV